MSGSFCKEQGDVLRLCRSATAAPVNDLVLEHSRTTVTSGSIVLNIINMTPMAVQKLPMSLALGSELIGHIRRQHPALP